MRNHGEVGVFALSHGFGKLDVDGVGVRVLVGWLHSICNCSENLNIDVFFARNKKYPINSNEKWTNRE